MSDLIFWFSGNVAGEGNSASSRRMQDMAGDPGQVASVAQGEHQV